MKRPGLVDAILSASFALLALCVQPVLAVTILTEAERITASGSAIDTQGPATSGSLFSEVLDPDGLDISFTGSAYARAAANVNGTGAVTADGVFASGSAADNIMTGLSILTSEFTNNTGGIAPFEYSFFLPGPRLTIADFAGLSASDPSTINVFFDFRVSMDFGSGFLPQVVSQGLLTGGIIEFVLDTAGTNPLGSAFFVDSASPNNIFGYQFDDFSGSVSGILADGEAVAVQSQLFVQVSAPGFETGGAASIGDPLNLGAGAFTGSFGVVPVPAAVWLFGSGLIGLIAVARRKSPAT